MATTSEAKLGFLIPSTNTTVERDAQRLLPPDLSAHFQRMPYDGDDRQASARLLAEAPLAAALLADARVQAIAFACTTGSVDRGPGYDQSVIDAIHRVADVPVTTTATALLKALRVLEARTVALLTPYEAWEDKKVVAFLEGNGFTVETVRGLGIADPHTIADVPPRQIARELLGLATNSDVIFVSCTAFRAIEALELIGERAGRPVLTSNQVTFWAATQLLEGAAELPRSLRIGSNALKQ